MGNATHLAATVHVEPMTGDHADAVLAVFAEGIATGHATFQAEPPTWEEFDTGHREDLRLVAVDGSGSVLGWVAASPVSGRCVYAGVVEVSLYVASAARGRGVGRLLMDALLQAAAAAGVWTAQSGVFPENAASLALHEAAGFRVVGRRERLGLMSHGPLAGQWRDVLLLEKRL
ncbi:GNAT family N-acetyltransferase [Cellulomonas olei]